jgi:putative Holliday junction resolvase
VKEGFVPITGNKRTRYLALDIGSKRIGIAISDSNKTMALPYEVYSYQDDEKLQSHLEEIIRRESIEKVIIGDPLNVNNERSSLNQGLHDTIDYLNENLQCETILWNEKLSTKTAHSRLMQGSINNKKRKKVVDQVAASIILQHYLDSL